MSEGWIGVDLDGTLAEYLGWQGMGHIGEPIAPMVERVKAWLAVGKDVRIFTARVCSSQSQEDLDVFLREYTRWCFQVFGRQLPVTSEKDWKMIELWDDRCVQIMPNIGIMVQDALVREVQSMKNDDVKRRARIAELEQENRELLAKCEKYECEIGLSKQRIAALESKSNMYADLAVTTASAACKVDVLEKERDRLREALKEIAKFADSEFEKRLLAPSCVEFLTIKRHAEKALEGAGK